MPKHEGKGVSIKSMTVFVTIIFAVLSGLLIATYYGFDWWYNNTLQAQYQPKYAGDILVAKLAEFNQKNNRYPANAQEFLNYLTIKNPVFVSPAGAFRLKNYVYSYRLLDGGKLAVLWVVPSPKKSQVAPSDTETYQEIEALRAKFSEYSPAYFIVVAPKITRRFQGKFSQKLADIDRLPDQPSANQLNAVGLFEKR